MSISYTALQQFGLITQKIKRFALKFQQNSHGRGKCHFFSFFVYGKRKKIFDLGITGAKLVTGTFQGLHLISNTNAYSMSKFQK